MDSIVLSPTVYKRLSKELQALTGQPHEGIRVKINEEDLADVQAFILGPVGTPYAGGLFRVKIQFTSDYPTQPPKCFFTTKLFHPNVSSSGEICVSTLKKDWLPTLGLSHILLTIKCLMIYPNPESALNEEAGRMLLERYEDYEKRARMWTEIHARINEEFSALFSNEIRKLGETSADNSNTSGSNDGKEISTSGAESQKKNDEENLRPVGDDTASPSKKRPTSATSANEVSADAAAPSTQSNQQQKKKTNTGAVNEKKRSLKRL